MNKYHPNTNINNLCKDIIEIFQEKEEVSAIFTSGSTAFGGNDEYSDLDINLVFDKSFDHKEFILDALAKMVKVDLFFTPPGLDHILVVYTDELVKIDFGIYLKDSNLKLTAKEKVIYDPNNLLEENNGESDGNTEKLKEEADNYLNMVIANLFAVRRELKRNNLFEARSNLDEARLYLATYYNLKNSVRFYGYADFTNFIDKSAEILLRKSLLDTNSPIGMYEAALNLLQIVTKIENVNHGLVYNIRDKLRGALYEHITSI